MKHWISTICTLILATTQLSNCKKDDAIKLVPINATSINWVKANGRVISSLASAGSNVFASADNGIYSSSSGSGWSQTSSALSAVGVNCLMASGNNIFAGTNGSGIYLSTDNGASWSAVNLGLPDPTFVYSLVTFNNLILAATEEGLYSSSNDGQTWALIYSEMFSCLAINGSHIFGGNGYGVSMSVDNGTTWDMVGYPPNVNALAVIGPNIVAGTWGSGVSISTNSGVNLSSDGSSWSTVTSGLSKYATINSFQVIGNNIFAGTPGNGVYVSTTNGSSWSQANTGLPPGVDVLCFATSGNERLWGIYFE